MKESTKNKNFKSLEAVERERESYILQASRLKNQFREVYKKKRERKRKIQTKKIKRSGNYTDCISNNSDCNFDFSRCKHIHDSRE